MRTILRHLHNNKTSVESSDGVLILFVLDVFSCPKYGWYDCAWPSVLESSPIRLPNVIAYQEFGSLRDIRGYV